MDWEREERLTRLQEAEDIRREAERRVYSTPMPMVALMAATFALVDRALAPREEAGHGGA